MIFGAYFLNSLDALRVSKGGDACQLVWQGDVPNV